MSSKDEFAQLFAELTSQATWLEFLGLWWGWLCGTKEKKRILTLSFKTVIQSDVILDSQSSSFS